MAIISRCTHRWRHSAEGVPPRSPFELIEQGLYVVSYGKGEAERVERRGRSNTLVSTEFSSVHLPARAPRHPAPQPLSFAQIDKP